MAPLLAGKVTQEAGMLNPPQALLFAGKFEIFGKLSKI